MVWSRSDKMSIAMTSCLVIFFNLLSITQTTKKLRKRFELVNIRVKWGSEINGNRKLTELTIYIVFFCFFLDFDELITRTTNIGILLLFRKLISNGLKEVGACFKFLLIRNSKYSVILSKLHSHRPLFRRFCPLGRDEWWMPSVHSDVYIFERKDINQSNEIFRRNGSW